MNDFENLLRNIEERMQGVEEKIRRKLDSIDKVVNQKLKAHGFGWDDDDDVEYTQTAHTAGSTENYGDKYYDVARKLEEMAPFMDEETLHNMVYEFLYGDLEMNMSVVLPFLGEEDISLLMKEFLKNGGEPYKGLRVKDMLPFANEIDVDALFIYRVKAGHIDRDMMPFVSDKCWHEIVKDYCKDEESTLNIDAFYPYLDDHDIQLLFKTYLKRRKKHRKK